jgi:large subunit ribosomal protein L2
VALIKVKPTSPGRRSLVKVVNANLHKGRPHDALLEKKSSQGGRNNHGHITVRHQGGGHKQHYRVVDFRRTKDGIAAKVERLEYDPNRTANLALLCYADGEWLGSAHQAGQRAADPKYPGRYDHTLH